LTVLISRARRERIARGGLLLLLSGALLVLLLSMGLAAFVADARLAGAEPPPALHSVHFTDGAPAAAGGPRLNYRQLLAVAERAGLPDLLTAQVSNMIFGRDPERMHSYRVAYIAGDLQRQLGLSIYGQAASEPSLAASLAGGGAREMLLSEALAKELFGSVEGALGQTLHFHDMLSMHEQRSLEFTVTGVVLGGFSGPQAEDPVQAWLPLAAWHSLILPAHQPQDILDMAPQFVGMVDPRPVELLKQRFDRALQQRAELSEYRTLLLKGLGPAPERRMALAQWADSLRLSVGVLLIALVLAQTSQRWLQLERSRPDDLVRAVVGETPDQRWRRHFLAGARDVLLVGALSVLGLGLLQWGAAPDGALPLREALAALKPSPVLIAQLLGLAVLLCVLPLLLHRLAGAAGLDASRRVAYRLGSHALSLVLLSVVACGLSAAAALMSMEQAQRLVNRELGFAPSELATAAIRPANPAPRAQAMQTFDGRSVQGLLPEQGDETYALASLAPIDSGEPIKAQVRTTEREWRGEVSLNEVSANYFDLLGTRIAGDCPLFDSGDQSEVIVNEAFMRRYAGGAAQASVQLKLQNISDGVLFKPARICAVAPDHQWVDVRGTPVPMIYRPLKNMSGARVALLKADARGLQPALESLRRRLQESFPDYQLHAAEHLEERVLAMLVGERAVAHLSVLVSAAVFVLAVLLSAQVALIAIGLQRQALAVRWALGADAFRLLRSAFGHSLLMPVLVGALALGAGVALMLWLLPQATPETLYRAALAAVFAMLAAALLSLLPALLRLRRQSLIAQLGS
jgi:hypothetical protein